MNSIIWSEDEIKKFFNLIFPSTWSKNEIAFISLAARNKYSKEKIDLGHRPEMLDKSVIKINNADLYFAKIKRFDTEGYLDNNNSIIPKEVMAIYVNINLSDTIKAWSKIKNRINEIDEEILSHSFFNSNKLDHAISQINNLPNIWFSQIQNTYSRKFWIDIDVDIEDPNQVWTDKKTLREVLVENIHSQSLIRELKNTIIIHTRGGFHILINCRENQFDKRINPETIRESIEYQVVDFTKEVVINKNGMVPCPGTYQGGYKVYAIYFN